MKENDSLEGLNFQHGGRGILLFLNFHQPHYGTNICYEILKKKREMKSQIKEAQ